MSAAFELVLLPGGIDQDLAHRFGGCGEEMRLVVPLAVLRTGQAQPGFVDKRGGLKGMTGGLAGDLVRDQLAEFVVNQREQFLGGLRISGLRALKDARDPAHGTT